MLGKLKAYLGTKVEELDSQASAGVHKEPERPLSLHPFGPFRAEDCVGLLRVRNKGKYNNEEYLYAEGVDENGNLICVRMTP